MYVVNVLCRLPGAGRVPGGPPGVLTHGQVHGDQHQLLGPRPQQGEAGGHLRQVRGLSGDCFLLETTVPVPRKQGKPRTFCYNNITKEKRL